MVQGHKREACIAHAKIPHHWSIPCSHKEVRAWLIFSLAGLLSLQAQHDIVLQFWPPDPTATHRKVNSHYRAAAFPVRLHKQFTCRLNNSFQQSSGCPWPSLHTPRIKVISSSRITLHLAQACSELFIITKQQIHLLYKTDYQDVAQLWSLQNTDVN